MKPRNITTTLGVMWRQHKLLMLGFVFAIVALVLLCVRLAVLTVYFANHRDAELAGWMPVGYVSRSYSVAPQTLQQALGIPVDGSPRVTIGDVAKAQNRPLAAIERDILEAVQRARAAQ